MNPSESLQRFERFVAGSGRTVGELDAQDAVHLMVEFYRQVRAKDCDLDADGDTVCFQWGVSGSGDKETFHYDLTRQFIGPGDEDEDGMSQLSLTVHFPVTDALRALEGEEWCSSPYEVDALEQFVASHPATRAIASLTPLRTTLDWAPI